MDTSDENIFFDENGVCNHCFEYQVNKNSILKHGIDGQKELAAIIEKARQNGNGRPYDCIIGLSGGVDSSYVAYKIVKLGLRPLAVHFDSGWNSEKAVHNIENIVKKLNIDLFTYVCDWKEMQDLQLSYFKAGVINADIPMDHSFMVVLHRIAKKHNIKYFFSGHNFETEGILPKSWVYKSTDSTNLKAIQKRFGKVRLSNFPTESIITNLYTRAIYGLKVINILNFEKYDKTIAMDLIQKELGWQYYGGKHYESIFTRFYQGYYLPRRFSVDKRRAHLSTLINSNQISRENALNEITLPTYPDSDLLNEDLEFVPKKLGISTVEFNDILNQPVAKHTDYQNDNWIRKLIILVGKLLLRKEIQL